jgi:hypothetical protein
VENLNVSSSPASAGGVVSCTQNLDEFDILNLADMALERRQRLFEAAGIPWPEKELKDSVRITVMLNLADLWDDWQRAAPDIFQCEMDEAVVVARQYFTVEGVE